MITTVQPGGTDVSMVDALWQIIQSQSASVRAILTKRLNDQAAQSAKTRPAGRSAFFGLKGALKSEGDASTDKQLLDDYLSEKYDV
jgi:hypothetical protein